MPEPKTGPPAGGPRLILQLSAHQPVTYGGGGLLPTPTGSAKGHVGGGGPAPTAVDTYMDPGAHGGQADFSEAAGRLFGGVWAPPHCNAGGCWGVGSPSTDEGALELSPIAKSRNLEPYIHHSVIQFLR